MRPLAVGTELEVEFEGGWVAVQVADVHPDHQYTLVVHPADERDAAPEQAEADAAAGAADAAGQGPADVEGDEVLALRVHIVSDSLLDVLDSDGSEPEGGSERCHWRTAPTSLSQMFSNAFQDMARRQPLPQGVELPSADDMAAMMTQASRGVGQMGFWVVFTCAWAEGPCLCCAHPSTLAFHFVVMCTSPLSHCWPPLNAAPCRSWQNWCGAQ